MSTHSKNELNATPFETAPPGTFDPLLAPGWVIEGRFDMWDVAAFVRTQQKAHPDATLFAVLEDVGQAFYTSGHSLGRNNLDYYDPETEAELTKPSDFPKRHALFMDYVAKSQSKTWHNQMGWAMPDDGCASLLGFTPERPDVPFPSWGRDTKSYVMRVPVTAACEAIAAFPNGYFSDDLQPDQNYYLAKAMEDKFGFRIFGLGATYAGYMRGEPLSADEAQALGVFLSLLYSNEPQDLAGKIAKIATGQHTLFLAYANR